MFFGREELIDQLSSLCRKRVASLVTCRGRRRVGKSTLIEVFAEKNGCRFIKLEGRRPAAKLTNADELWTFVQQLSAQTNAPKAPVEDWPEAFRRLSAAICDRSWTVVLLDEVSWLAHYDESFADNLKIAWDNVFKKHPKLILVVCGSVSSWIKDSIVDNPAFMGRRSLDVVVPELPLRECVKFWGKKGGPNRSARDNRRAVRDGGHPPLSRGNRSVAFCRGEHKKAVFLPECSLADRLRRDVRGRHNGTG